jgi:hypothetical protein
LIVLGKEKLNVLTQNFGADDGLNELSMFWKI